MAAPCLELGRGYMLTEYIASIILFCMKDKYIHEQYAIHTFSTALFFARNDKKVRVGPGHDRLQEVIAEVVMDYQRNFLTCYTCRRYGRVRHCIQRQDRSVRMVLTALSRDKPTCS